MGAVYLMLALLIPRLKSTTGLFVCKAWSQCNRRLRFDSYMLGESSQVRRTIARFRCGVKQRLAQREAENDDQPNVKLRTNSRVSVVLTFFLYLVPLTHISVLFTDYCSSAHISGLHDRRICSVTFSKTLLRLSVDLFLDSLTDSYVLIL